MAARQAAAVHKDVDYANYFCTYSFLYHQKEMLSDVVRMDAYHGAIMSNKHHFQGKAVLDVGAGSGILSIWAAQAGARKVYGVEATDMAKHARALVKHNQLESVVEIIQGSMEEVELPEKVDVIISEWMGFFLVRESMLDSVISARDKWLKPDGMLYPSHARMWLAPVATRFREKKQQEYVNSMEDWQSFSSFTKSRYNVDMGGLNLPFDEEQKKYYLQTSMWCNLFPDQVLSAPYLIQEIDCSTITVEQMQVIQSDFNFLMGEEKGRVDGFGGWFDVHFKGSVSNPAEKVVELSTAPMADSTTHWGQQLFLLQPPVEHDVKETLGGSIKLSRSKKNHRLMDVSIVHRLKDEDGKTKFELASTFFIE